jgi:hypothetical protein
MEPLRGLVAKLRSNPPLEGRRTCRGRAISSGSTPPAARQILGQHSGMRVKSLSFRKRSSVGCVLAGTDHDADAVRGHLRHLHGGAEHAQANMPLTTMPSDGMKGHFQPLRTTNTIIKCALSLRESASSCKPRAHRRPDTDTALRSGGGGGGGPEVQSASAPGPAHPVRTLGRGAQAPRSTLRHRSHSGRLVETRASGPQAWPSPRPAAWHRQSSYEIVAALILRSSGHTHALLTRSQVGCLGHNARRSRDAPRAVNARPALHRASCSRR